MNKLNLNVVDYNAPLEFWVMEKMQVLAFTTEQEKHISFNTKKKANLTGQPESEV